MFKFLPDDYAALKEYVAEAERRKAKALASIGEVIEQTSGTWHDNPAFDFAQEQSRMWTDEVRKRMAILAQAEIIDPSQQSVEVVTISSRVVYRNETQGFVDEITIGSYLNIGPNRERDDVISYASPLGNAIMGCGAGATVQVQLPNRTFTVTIIEISETS